LAYPYIGFLRYENFDKEEKSCYRTYRYLLTGTKLQDIDFSGLVNISLLQKADISISCTFILDGVSSYSDRIILFTLKYIIIWEYFEFRTEDLITSGSLGANSGFTGASIK